MRVRMYALTGWCRPCGQALTESLRLKEEFYLDDAITTSFVSNTFGEHHFSLSTIRRHPDVWEWGNQVLWPGLLGDSGPGCGTVGRGGHFNSSLDGHGPSDISGAKGGCNDNSWVDGESLNTAGAATSYSVPELLGWMNRFDWTDGVVIVQQRVAEVSAEACGVVTHGGRCLPGIEAPHAILSEAPFGYNWTHPAMPLTHPFVWYSPDDLGQSRSGLVSAHQATGFRTVISSGFASAIVPFFSATWLPEERGPAASVTNLTAHRLTPSNNGSQAAAAFFCVRLSWDGDHVHQLCDPNEEVDGVNRTTGLVRAAIEEFWNDLKRAHYIDDATRSLTITVPFAANHVGVSMRMDVQFEFTPTSAVFPSYTILSRVHRADLLARTRTFSSIALGLTALFLLLEGVELCGEGVAAYFSNLWNIMDWVNFVLFFVVYAQLHAYLALVDTNSCGSFCQSVGYRDNSAVMVAARDLKTYLSLCVTIQLLKVIKFCSALVPKMGLAPMVLKKALPDIVFFVAVFLLTLVAFSQLFYVQLGPFMIQYMSQQASFISLGRALFGDFDVDGIISNSPGYLAITLFLLYMFVAVFILLSMFFAILGESQAALRDDQRDDKKEAEKKGITLPPEYGVFESSYRMAIGGFAWLFPAIYNAIESSFRKQAIEAEHRRPSAVDRVEARQLQMLDRIDDLMMALGIGGDVARGPSASNSNTVLGCAGPDVQSKAGAEHGGRIGEAARVVASKAVSEEQVAATVSSALAHQLPGMLHSALTPLREKQQQTHQQLISLTRSIYVAGASGPRMVDGHVNIRHVQLPQAECVSATESAPEDRAYSKQGLSSGAATVDMGAGKGGCMGGWDVPNNQPASRLRAAFAIADNSGAAKSRDAVDDIRTELHETEVLRMSGNKLRAVPARQSAGDMAVSAAGETSDSRPEASQATSSTSMHDAEQGAAKIQSESAMSSGDGNETGEAVSESCSRRSVSFGPGIPVDSKNMPSVRGVLATDDAAKAKVPQGSNAFTLVARKAHSHADVILMKQRLAQVEQDKGPRKLCDGPLLVDPRTSKWLTSWDMVTALALLYTAFVTPFEVSFLVDSSLGRFVANRVIDVIFSADICLQFFLAYPAKVTFTGRGASWITDHDQIVRHYLFGWFLLDAFSTLVSIFDIVAYTSGNTGLSRFQMLRVPRALVSPSRPLAHQHPYLLNRSHVRNCSRSPLGFLPAGASRAPAYETPPPPPRHAHLSPHRDARCHRLRQARTFPVAARGSAHRALVCVHLGTAGDLNAPVYAYMCARVLTRMCPRACVYTCVVCGYTCGCGCACACVCACACMWAHCDAIRNYLGHCR